MNVIIMMMFVAVQIVFVNVFLKPKHSFKPVCLGFRNTLSEDLSL